MFSANSKKNSLSRFFDEMDPEEKEEVEEMLEFRDNTAGGLYGYGILLICLITATVADCHGWASKGFRNRAPEDVYSTFLSKCGHNHLFGGRCSAG